MTEKEYLQVERLAYLRTAETSLVEALKITDTQKDAQRIKGVLIDTRAIIANEIAALPALEQS
jgi:hypothetical protein